MFRAPLGATFFSGASKLTSQLLSEESLRRSGLFQPNAVHKARQAYEQGELGSLQRVFVEMGLTAVISTQLWHHKYLGGGLCDLPEADFRTAAAPADSPPSWSEAPKLEPAGAF
jgi:asparagine synthase (glutamine-hydrolysing)